MEFKNYLSAFFMLSGALFILVAAFGTLRLPDLYMRISAATKVSTVGIGLCLLALAVDFAELGLTSRAIATILFIAVSSPVAGHLISRSAYISKVPLWENNRVDELEGQYNEKTGRLMGIKKEL